MENKAIQIEPKAATYFEVLQLDRGILRVRPLYGNQTNMMRTCTVAVTAMGKTTYIYLSQDANPF